MALVHGILVLWLGRVSSWVPLHGLSSWFTYCFWLLEEELHGGIFQPFHVLMESASLFGQRPRHAWWEMIWSRTILLSLTARNIISTLFYRESRQAH